MDSGNKVKLVDTRKAPAKKSRKQRRSEARSRKLHSNVIKKMFALLKPTEPMTQSELVTEAHLLHRNKYLTKAEARLVGCNLR